MILGMNAMPVDSVPVLFT